MKVFDRRTAIQHGGAAALFGLSSSACATPPADPYPFKALGACTPLHNADAIKAAGGDYVEEAVRRFMAPDIPEAEWIKKLAEAEACPLPVRACNSFLPGSLRSTGKDANHEGILQYAETAFRRGRQAGIEVIVFGSSKSRELKGGFPKSKAEQQFVSLLKEMGPLAELYGIMVVVEPLRRQECNFINTVIEGAQIVEQVNHPNIRLLFDIYHMLQNGEDPSDLKQVGHLLAHGHMAEKEKRTAPGVAGDDFRPFFTVLKQIGYNGCISIEGNWQVEELPKAYQVIRQQAREA